MSSLPGARLTAACDGGVPLLDWRAMAKKSSLNPHSLTGARRAALSEKVKPSLATLVDKAPSGDDWLHEVKFDGYRILAAVQGKRVKLISRNGLDWTARFAKIAGDLARLRIRDAVLDGEVVAVNAKGVSDFGALQQALSDGATGRLIYYVFDLLHCDGYDLRRSPLEERKALLVRRLVGAPTSLHCSEHHAGEGPAFFRSACEMQ